MLFFVVKMSNPVDCPVVAKSLKVSPCAYSVRTQVQEYTYPKSVCAVTPFPVPVRSYRGGLLASTLCCSKPCFISRLWSVTSFCIRVTVFCSSRLARKAQGWGGMLVSRLLASFKEGASQGMYWMEGVFLVLLAWQLFCPKLILQSAELFLIFSSLPSFKSCLTVYGADVADSVLISGIISRNCVSLQH